MPIYEYSCSKCGGIVEQIQKFSDPPLKRHRGCGGTLTKLISQSAFHLKGSGWYVTDYARKGSGNPTDGEGKAEDKKETPGEGVKTKDTKTDKDTASKKSPAKNSEVGPKK